MKKSKFMRTFYKSAYEDPIWELISRNTTCKEAYDERTTLEESFRDALENLNPELCKKFDELISSSYHFENLLFEEFYILGAQDRDEALAEQE